MSQEIGENENAEQTAQGRHAARVLYRKNQGNDAFKENNYQQAAVHYTEALTLDETQHAIYSNPNPHPNRNSDPHPHPHPDPNPTPNQARPLLEPGRLLPQARPLPAGA